MAHDGIEVGKTWDEVRYGFFNRDGRLICTQEDPFEDADMLPGDRVLTIVSHCEVTGMRYSTMAHGVLPVVKRIETVNGEALVDLGDKGVYLPAISGFLQITAKCVKCGHVSHPWQSADQIRYYDFNHRMHVFEFTCYSCKNER